MPRPIIGLALSGAAARGPAHIGVLRVLEESGLPIDVISGVSAGALVGALYAAGYSVNEIWKYNAELGWGRFLTPTLPLHGFGTMIKLEWWLRKLIGCVDIGELKRPFAISATDFDTGEPVTLLHGDTATAVRASCSVPIVSSPVWFAKRRLCDGGISCNVPSQVARTLGADFVIGVDLFLPKQRYWRWAGPLAVMYFATENMVRRSGGGLDDVDYLVDVPAIAGATYVRFSERDALVQMGEQAMRAHLPKLRARLAEIGAL